jgi:hypothetical protein
MECLGLDVVVVVVVGLNVDVGEVAVVVSMASIRFV